MTRSPRLPVDPVVGAAGLLRRVGFGLLVAAGPLLAVGSRRGLVIIAPLAIVLMVLATVIESEGRQPLQRAWRALRSPTGGIATFLAFWAGLSLLWTPFPGEAADRLLNIVGVGLGGLIAVAALPDRMRVSNLYLLPIGLGFGAILAVVLGLRTLMGRSADPALDHWLLERGLIVIVLMTPAAVTWLLTKDRLVSGFVLVVLVTVAVVLAEAYAGMAALGTGAAVFALATVRPAAGRVAALVLLPGLVLIAPAIPLALRAITKMIYGPLHPLVETVRTWGRIVTDDPLRLITGHGLDTALRAKLAGLVPQSAPSGLLSDVWFELGFLGAIALALLLGRAVLAAGRLSPGVVPGALMTLVVAFVLAITGQGAAQSWWLMSLVLAAVVIIAVDRGQYRTSRPKSGTAPPREAVKQPQPISAPKP